MDTWHPELLISFSNGHELNFVFLFLFAYPFKIFATSLPPLPAVFTFHDAYKNSYMPCLFSTTSTTYKKLQQYLSEKKGKNCGRLTTILEITFCPKKTLVPTYLTLLHKRILKTKNSANYMKEGRHYLVIHNHYTAERIRSSEFIAGKANSTKFDRFITMVIGTVMPELTIDSESHQVAPQAVLK